MNYPPFLCLFGLAIAARIVLMALYFPAVMLWVDAPRFARMGGMRMFDDFWMPAGYPFFLQVLRAISPEMWFTIAVQHGLGLGTGVLVFLAMQRAGTGKLPACIAAAVPFFSGDHLYLEHVVMADFLLTFLATAGLTAAVFGMVNGARLKYLGAASVLLASAALVRSVGVVLLPILSLCAAVAVRKTGRDRIAMIGAGTLPGLVVFSLYVGVFFLAGGKYLGLADMRGWNLYSRAAPFADCRKFQPAAETVVLCEERQPAERPGPFGYVWDPDSISRRSFPIGPESGGKLGAFAREAILHQPGDYVRAVALDLARYVEPSIARPRPYSGQPREIISFRWRDLEVERTVVEAMGKGYRGTGVQTRSEKMLGAYQDVMRVGGLPLLALAALTLLGMATGVGPPRFASFLFGLSAFALYLLPVLTVSYDFRYGIPPETLLGVSGVIGAVSSWRRFLVGATT